MSVSLLGRAPRPLRYDDGLTLLELVLVLFILGAISAAAVSLVGQLDDQERSRDAIGLLENIRDGIQGRPDPSGPRGGFIVDLGRPPQSLDELLTGQGLLEGSLVETTGFSATIDGGERLPVTAFGTPWTLPPTARLYKGFRSGYLATRPLIGDEVPTLRDPWGNELDWNISTASGATTLEIVSVGADGVDDASRPAGSPPREGERDVALTLDPASWGVPVAGRTVVIENASGAPLPAGFRVAWQAFVARTPGETGSNWVQYLSSVTTVAIDAGATGLVAFPPAPNRPFLPRGDHLLLLVTAGSTPATGPDGDVQARRVFLRAGDPLTVPERLVVR